jgi:hypothetical protein
MGWHPKCNRCGEETTVYEDENGKEIPGINYCEKCKVIQ